MIQNQDPIFLARRFEKIFHSGFPLVKRFALMLLKSEEDAEDMAQEVFTQLWEQPELWANHTSSMNDYLFIITKNAIFDYLRHRQVEQNYREGCIKKIAFNDFALREEPLENMYYKEMQLIVKIALDKMPPKRREIFEMSRFKGLHHKEIAEKLQISIRTVEHQVYLASAALKKILYAITLFF